MNKFLLLLLLVSQSTLLFAPSKFNFCNSFFDPKYGPTSVLNVGIKPVADEKLILNDKQFDDFCFHSTANESIDLKNCEHFVWTAEETIGKKLFATTQDLLESKIILKLGINETVEEVWEEIATIKLSKNRRICRLLDWSIFIVHPINYATICHNPKIDGPIKTIDYLSETGIIVTFVNGRRVLLNLTTVGLINEKPVYQWHTDHFCKIILPSDKNYEQLHEKTNSILKELETSKRTLSWTELYFGRLEDRPYVVVCQTGENFFKIALSDSFGKLYFFSKSKLNDNRWTLESTIELDDENQAIIFNNYLKKWPEYFPNAFDWDPFCPIGISFSIPNQERSKLVRFSANGDKSTPEKIDLVLLPSGTLVNRT